MIIFNSQENALLSYCHFTNGKTAARKIVTCSRPRRLYMVVVTSKCFNLARLREFLEILFLRYFGLRWVMREILVGDLEGRQSSPSVARTHCH